jgi:predicted regulator of Ras-like GTPase activity (Roadblock/LC7/MglB family)
MGFGEHLDAVVNSVDGAIAASVMGFDGIAVETRQHKPEAMAELDLTAAWVEFANVLSQLKLAAETLKTGKVQELSLASEKVHTIVRIVNQDYFMVLGLQPSGNIGKGRYLLRVTAPKVAAEL